MLSCGRTVVTNLHYHIFHCSNKRTNPNDTFNSRMDVTVPQCSHSLGYVCIYFRSKNSKMMIRGIGISPLKNILNPFSVRWSANYYTINQKNETTLVKARAEHEKKCRSEVRTYISSYNPTIYISYKL